MGGQTVVLGKVATRWVFNSSSESRGEMIVIVLNDKSCISPDVWMTYIHGKIHWWNTLKTCSGSLTSQLTRSLVSLLRQPSICFCCPLSSFRSHCGPSVNTFAHLWFTCWISSEETWFEIQIPTPIPGYIVFTSHKHLTASFFLLWFSHWDTFWFFPSLPVFPKCRRVGEAAASQGFQIFKWLQTNFCHIFRGCLLTMLF